MNYSVGIVDIVVDADAVDITGRVDLPSATGIIRARRSKLLNFARRNSY